MNMSKKRFHFPLQLEALDARVCPSGSASTVTLPISAFLAQQGHDSFFFTSVKDEQGWSNSTFDPGATSSDPNRLLTVDYAGLWAQYLLQHGINLHTTVTGFVTETPIVNTGLMEVSVNLEATNALTVVANIEGINGNGQGVAETEPLELGYRPADLVGHPERTPALSDVHYQVTWQEDVGAALPDLARLNEPLNPNPYVPPGFSYERFDFQSWGTGTLGPATTVGTPGQTAIVSTYQVGDVTNPNLPGNYPLPDGFFQEPVDLIPISSASTHVAFLNGTLFVQDTSNGNDHVQVTPAANGGATVSSNLGNGTFAAVTKVVVGLGGGNNNVQIGNLPGTTVDVAALDGNNNITVGNAGKLVVSVGGGNNNIHTGNTSPAAQFVCAAGNGNNNIDVANANANAAEILVNGNGNNNINAAGTSDFIEVLGNGNNNIKDTGTDDLVWLGGDGSNNIDNQGTGSFTEILAGTGHKKIHGPFRIGGAPS